MDRKKYITPSLKTYGDVAQLTLGDHRAYRYKLSASGGRKVNWRKLIIRKRLRRRLP